MSTGRILAAETLGTFILMMGGPGSAVLAGDVIGVAGISIAFGLSLLVAAYAVGHVSGCHINPAVTIGLAIMRKTKVSQVPTYIVGQLIGGALGGLFIFWIARGRPGGFSPDDSNFAVNGWAQLSPGGYDFGSMVLVEILLTAVLVFAVLSTTRKAFAPAAIGLTVGLVLTLIHLVSIPIDNTSVNPARSFGMAIFAGGDAIEQLWAFIVFPIIGAVVGAMFWLSVDDATLEDTMLGDSVLTKARDQATKVTDRVESAMDTAGDKLDDVGD